MILMFIGIGIGSVSADMKKILSAIYRIGRFEKWDLSVLIGIGRYEKKLIVRPLSTKLQLGFCLVSRRVHNSENLAASKR